jgi:hypothetical protein
MDKIFLQYEQKLCVDPVDILSELSKIVSSKYEYNQIMKKSEHFVLALKLDPQNEQDCSLDGCT